MGKIFPSVLIVGCSRKLIEGHNSDYIYLLNVIFYGLQNRGLSPTYIYSAITADSHYFGYFLKQKYFVLIMISWAPTNWRSGMYITIDWMESEIWALWILNGCCYIFCIFKPDNKRVTLYSVGVIATLDNFNLIGWYTAKYQNFITSKGRIPLG